MRDHKIKNKFTIQTEGEKGQTTTKKHKRHFKSNNSCEHDSKEVTHLIFSTLNTLLSEISCIKMIKRDMWVSQN